MEKGGEIYAHVNKKTTYPFRLYALCSLYLSGSVQSGAAACLIYAALIHGK